MINRFWIPPKTFFFFNFLFSKLFEMLNNILPVSRVCRCSSKCNYTPKIRVVIFPQLILYYVRKWVWIFFIFSHWCRKTLGGMQKHITRIIYFIFMWQQCMLLLCFDCCVYRNSFLLLFFLFISIKYSG